MAVAERFLNLSKFDLRSDRSLVRAAQAGKRDAAAQLIERYYPRVKSFVTYLSASRGNAEDLTQEVFARALTALPRFNGTYRFEPWLLRIARNLCIDESRRSSNRAAPTDPIELPALERIAETEDNVWGRVSSGLATQLVHNALQTLPARQRTALVLREIEGMSYADIAQVLGGTERVVEGILRRARARFRLEIAKAEEVEDQRATCKRVLRAIATEPATMSLDAARHLRKCPECQQGRRRIKKSDGIFAALPPVALTHPSWTEAALGSLKAKAAHSRTVLELFRHHSSIGLASPLVNALEMVASLAVAATLSVASITGQSARVTTQLGAAPSITSPVVVVAIDHEPQSSETPSSVGLSSGDVASSVDAADSSQLSSSAFADDPSLFPLPAGALNINIPNGLVEGLPALDGAQIALSTSIQDLEESVASVEAVRAAESGASIGSTDLPIELPDPLNTTAVPAGVTLPRRRFFLI
jgi:RNA polymerase sigma-70 factor (ECF subfamily)